MYLILKAVHIVAVVVFLGNISIGVFWKRIADRTGSAAIVAHTLAGIILADRLFTIPGIVVIVAAGIALGVIGDIPFLRTGWLLWGIILFIISGLAFGPVARAQAVMLECAESGLRTPEQRERYEKQSRLWDFWGTIALAAPIVALFLMVLKPQLPALP